MRSAIAIGPGGVFSGEGGRSQATGEILMMIRPPPPPPLRGSAATLRDRGRGCCAGGWEVLTVGISPGEPPPDLIRLRSCGRPPVRLLPGPGGVFSGEGGRSRAAGKIPMIIRPLAPPPLPNSAPRPRLSATGSEAAGAGGRSWPSGSPAADEDRRGHLLLQSCRARPSFYPQPVRPDPRPPPPPRQRPLGGGQAPRRSESGGSGLAQAFGWERGQCSCGGAPGLDELGK